MRRRHRRSRGEWPPRSSVPSVKRPLEELSAKHVSSGLRRHARGGKGGGWQQQRLLSSVTRAAGRVRFHRLPAEVGPHGHAAVAAFLCTWLITQATYTSACLPACPPRVCPARLPSWGHSELSISTSWPRVVSNGKCLARLLPLPVLPAPNNPFPTNSNPHERICHWTYVRFKLVQMTNLCTVDKTEACVTLLLRSYRILPYAVQFRLSRLVRRTPRFDCCFSL